MKALLLDADGVVQNPSRGWIREWIQLGGATFLKELSEREVATLTGKTDLKPLVTELLDERGLDLTFEDVIEVWCRIDTDERMLALVDQVRNLGLLTVLATNQQAYRGGWMLENLGYEEHFDAQFHSFQVGLAKPDPAFFTHIVESLGIEPSEAVFVDDMPNNVAGARRAGLQAIHFSLLDTYGELRFRLRTLGVPGV